MTNSRTLLGSPDSLEPTDLFLKMVDVVLENLVFLENAVYDGIVPVEKLRKLLYGWVVDG